MSTNNSLKNRDAIYNIVFENQELKRKIKNLENNVKTLKQSNKKILKSKRYKLGLFIINVITEPLKLFKYFFKKTKKILKKFLRLFTKKKNKKIHFKTDTYSVFLHTSSDKDAIERDIINIKNIISLKQKHLEIIVIVTNNDEKYFKQLHKKYTNDPQVKILFKTKDDELKETISTKLCSIKDRLSSWANENPLILKHLNKTSNNRIYKKGSVKEKNQRNVTVSVVIPTYKDNPWVRQSINSVLKQHFPKDNLKIIVVVNGPDKEYFKKLKEEYKKQSEVKIYYTSTKGAAAARNLGVEKVTTKYLTFLDDDDFFTPGYLKNLSSYLDTNISIVCGKFLDLEDGQYNDDNYLNRALKSPQNQKGFVDVFPISSLFATICGKLYKTSLFKKNFVEFDNSLPNTEDVVFWTSNFEKIQGLITCVDKKSKEAYVRRKTQDSRSRPSKDSLFQFGIKDRIKIIKEISKRLFSPNLRITQKTFPLNKLKSQHKIMVDSFEQLNTKDQKKALEIIKKQNCFFINKGSFSKTRGIAFCYNFSPAADPAAYVATKRLTQIYDLSGKIIKWDVISSNLSNCRSLDFEFKNFYTSFVVNKLIKFEGPSYFNEKAQEIFSEKAFQTVSPIPYDFIYSRSMAAGSHIAAYKYKERHPDAIWYAEFSDPLYMDSHNKKRSVREEYEGEESYLNDYWRYVERTVYNFADVIIFTNENQRQYMLQYNNDVEMKQKVMKKSLILSHPILDKSFTEIHNSTYPIDREKINIAYFGSFYKNRSYNEMIKLTENPKVILHLFVSKPEELTEFITNPQIRTHNYVSHLEFLNIASRMDYLYLNDMSFKGELNPYLPSKFSDYLSSGSKIIAKTEPNSPISKIKNKNLIKVKSLTDNFIDNL